MNTKQMKEERKNIRAIRKARRERKGSVASRVMRETDATPVLLRNGAVVEPPKPAVPAKAKRKAKAATTASVPSIAVGNRVKLIAGSDPWFDGMRDAIVVEVNGKRIKVRDENDSDVKATLNIDEVRVIV